MGPSPNYWRYSSFSTTFFPCYNNEACLGSSIPSDLNISIRNLSCVESLEGDPSFCFTGFCGSGYTG